MFKQKSLDKYEVVARYIPAIISVIPLAHFLLIVLSKDFFNGLLDSVAWMLVANLSFPVVFGIGIVQLQTWFSKTFVEEAVFGKGGVNFPTTQILLYGEGLYSKVQKNNLRTLIQKKFNISLHPVEVETNNTVEARLLAREAVSQVRRSVGNAGMVHGYNIRYGFLRNLIGGIVWSVFGATGAAIYYWIHHDVAVMLFFIIWNVVHILMFTIKRYILNKAAFTYADALFTEFLSERK